MDNQDIRESIRNVLTGRTQQALHEQEPGPGQADPGDSDSLVSRLQQALDNIGDELDKIVPVLSDEMVDAIEEVNSIIRELQA